MTFVAIVQKIERKVPPSTRGAAPLVADESGLATNVISAAISSVVAKRCKSEAGPLGGISHRDPSGSGQQAPNSP